MTQGLLEPRRLPGLIMLRRPHLILENIEGRCRGSSGANEPAACPLSGVDETLCEQLGSGYNQYPRTGIGLGIAQMKAFTLWRISNATRSFVI